MMLDQTMPSTPTLTQAQLLAVRQCPRRLWLTLRHPDCGKEDLSGPSRRDAARQIKDIARRYYEAVGPGDASNGEQAACASPLDSMNGPPVPGHPIFNVPLVAEGVIVWVDVMLPAGTAEQPAWRLIMVTSSTRVKPHHRVRAALLAHVARQSGLTVADIKLAHVDHHWVYPGGADYRGLLREADLSAEVNAQAAAVEAWIKEAQAVAGEPVEPKACTGRHCTDPVACGFMEYCQRQELPVDYPVAWLPGVRTTALKRLIDSGARDMREISDVVLNGLQRRVKRSTLSGATYFDARRAAAELGARSFPVYFLDLETIQFAVPIWPGTRPYQPIAFQFSANCLSHDGGMTHRTFLDVSGADPSRALAEALTVACGKSGPVFVYNARFEAARMAELAQRFPDIQHALRAILARLIDLLPIAQACYYHPRQQGSWSLKSVLPAMAPDLADDLPGGVRDGLTAMAAYREAIAPETTQKRKAAIEYELLEYCGRDTYALIRLWLFFGRGSGNPAAIVEPVLAESVA